MAQMVDWKAVSEDECKIIRGRYKEAQKERAKRDRKYQPVTCSDVDAMEERIFTRLEQLETRIRALERPATLP